MSNEMPFTRAWVRGDVISTIEGLVTEGTEVNEDKRLDSDLGFDSLDFADLQVTLEARHINAGYNSEETAIGRASTVGQVADAVVAFYESAHQLRD